MSEVTPSVRKLRDHANYNRQRANTAKNPERAARYREIAEIFEQEAEALARQISNHQRPDKTPQRFATAAART